MTALTTREVITIRMDTGYTDDEILADFGTRPIILDDEVLYLTEPPSRRRLAAVIASMRGESKTVACPPNLREVEVAYRKAGSRPAQKIVAAKMGAEPRTVYRYCVAAGIKSWPEMHAHMAERHPA